MKWIIYLCVSMVMGFTSLEGGSYNSFIKQVGFCKLQSFETVSRKTSSGPYIFTSGNVKFGVGLSDVQFNGSIVSCGKCINVLSINKFYEFNEDITEWDYNRKHDNNFTVMVMDQCTDPICQSGFLDFDIYHEKQPVAYGNPTDLTWEYVECPVRESKIELLFCLGYDSCQSHNQENRTIEELYNDSIKDNWFTLYPRNFRIPIISMKVQGLELHDKNSWLWKDIDSKLLEKNIWTIEWTSEDGSTQSWDVNWREHFQKFSEPGYRGGIILSTNKQN